MIKTANMERLEREANEVVSPNKLNLDRADRSAS
jgi:hypothetical protein